MHRFWEQFEVHAMMQTLDAKVQECQQKLAADLDQLQYGSCYSTFFPFSCIKRSRTLCVFRGCLLAGQLQKSSLHSC